MIVRFATAGDRRRRRARHRVLRTWPAGQPATLVVIRRGVRITVDITPAWVA